MKCVPCRLQTWCRGEWRRKRRRRGWGGRGRRRIGGDTFVHLWWAVICRPCNGRSYCSPASGEGERFRQHLSSWWLVCVINCRGTSPTPSACVCVSVSECESEMPAFQFSLLQPGCSQGVLLGCTRLSLCLVSLGDITPQGWCGGRLGGFGL